MPRKQTMIFGPRYSDDDLLTIKESGNLVRWRPAEAMERMMHIKNKATNPLIIDYWNLVAAKMNAWLDIEETTRYYNKRECWGELEPMRLEPIDSFYTLEQYVALNQFV